MPLLATARAQFLDAAEGLAKAVCGSEVSTNRCWFGAIVQHSSGHLRVKVALRVHRTHNIQLANGELSSGHLCRRRCEFARVRVCWGLCRARCRPRRRFSLIQRAGKIIRPSRYMRSNLFAWEAAKRLIPRARGVINRGGERCRGRAMSIASQCASETRFGEPRAKRENPNRHNNITPTHGITNREQSCYASSAVSVRVSYYPRMRSPATLPSSTTWAASSTNLQSGSV